ncbi:MAG: hypothetical protein ACRC8P_03785, partial [Spiroplasma sp.]
MKEKKQQKTETKSNNILKSKKETTKKEKKINKTETEVAIIKKHGEVDKPFTKEQEIKQEIKHKAFKERKK